LKRLFLTLVLSAILLLSISVSQQAFADGTITKPVECTLMGPDFRNMALLATHTLTFTPTGADVDVTYTETPNTDPPSQLAVFVLDPGSGNAQFVPIAVGSATATFVGAADGLPHTVVVCAGMLATSTSLNTHVHTLSDNFNSPPPAFCGDGVVNQASEQCDPPSAGICDLNCLFVTSSSGTVVGFTEVPRFCGLKQMAVVDSPVPPGDFAEVSQPIIFAETVDLQVSNEQTLRVANTGGGDAEVNADLTLLDTDGETTDWEDLLGATFDRSNTRSHHLASQPFSSMTPITNNPFIDVLLGQTAPESNFVDRFLKVRPDAGDAAFSAAGRDLITFTQVLRLEVSCDPAASCPDGFILDNGECVLD